MIILSLMLSLMMPGDMFVVRYPISDSIRGLIYAPLDTIYVEDTSTLFSVSLGYLYGNTSSPRCVDSLIRTIYKKILPDTDINIQRYVKISIIGEVNSPRIIYVNENEPISNIIALGGGPTQFANLKKIKIILKDRSLKLDFYKATEQRLNLSQLNVSSGDVIVVPRKFSINFSHISAIISSIILLWSFYQTNFQNN